MSNDHMRAYKLEDKIVLYVNDDDFDDIDFLHDKENYTSTMGYYNSNHWQQHSVPLSQHFGYEMEYMIKIILEEKEFMWFSMMYPVMYMNMEKEVKRDEDNLELIKMYAGLK